MPKVHVRIEIAGAQRRVLVTLDQDDAEALEQLLRQHNPDTRVWVSGSIEALKEPPTPVLFFTP